MESEQETMDDTMEFQYRLINVVLDREIQNAELKYGPPSDEVNNDFENYDPMDNNYHNKPQYYRDLISRKNVNHSTPMWNQFVPSHVESMQNIMTKDIPIYYMKYLVSKIKNVDENQTAAEMDNAKLDELDNAVAQSEKTSDINPSPLFSSVQFGDESENVVLNSKSTEDFQMEDIQLVYDWQDDIKDFELQWGIADLL